MADPGEGPGGSGPPYLKVWICHWLVTDGSHKMQKFGFLPSVSFGSAFYGQIWLFDAS